MCTPCLLVHKKDFSPFVYCSLSLLSYCFEIPLRLYNKCSCLRCLQKKKKLLFSLVHFFGFRILFLQLFTLQGTDTVRRHHLVFNFGPSISTGVLNKSQLNKATNILLIFVNSRSFNDGWLFDHSVSVNTVSQYTLAFLFLCSKVYFLNLNRERATMLTPRPCKSYFCSVLI